MEQPISVLLKDFERNIKRQVKVTPDRLTTVWTRIIGPKYGPQTRLLGVKQNIMCVQVTSAALFQELSNFHKAKLLKDIQATAVGKKVRDIKFSQ